MKTAPVSVMCRSMAASGVLTPSAVKFAMGCCMAMRSRPAWGAWSAEMKVGDFL